MYESLSHYLNELLGSIPVSVYIGLALLFFSGTIIFILCYGVKKGAELSSKLLLLEYICLLFFTTVIFRPYDESIGYNLQPFWSYSKLMNHEVVIPAPDLVMNYVVFIPLGVLLGLSFKIIKWWKVMLLGGGISICIECLQYVTKRGFAEVDDVIHNTIGCMIGFGIYSLLKCYSYIQQKESN